MAEKEPHPRDAVEKLYIAYSKDVYRYLLNLVQDSGLAEDLLSETFLSAFIGWHRFRGDASVKTWLFGIARNLWLQSLRRKRTTVGLDELVEQYLQTTNILEDHVIDRLTIERVQQLIESLDKTVRTVVWMRVEGISYAEISQKLKISESSARVIDFRARRHLRQVLQNEGWKNEKSEKRM